MTELLSDLPPAADADDAAVPPDPPEVPDLDVARVAAGDVSAFRHLFETYWDRLYRYADRYLLSGDEAADVVEEVFLRLWRGRVQLGLGREVSGYQLPNYLYAMTRNLALDRLKHRKVETRFRERRAASLALEDPAAVPDPETEFAAKEQAAAIQQAIDTLSPRQRQVLQLRWHQRLSHEEIGTRLGIATKTVAVHLGRALQHLRDRLPDLLS